MKKKNILIITLILIIVITLITLFVINLRKDRETVKKNIEIINNSYNNLGLEVAKYNEIRNDITNFIDNFYYDTILEKYFSNLELLNKYDIIIGNITKEITILDSKCNSIYNDKEINNICNNYQKDYEIIVNVFINDLNNYNNKLSNYNQEENNTLELFKSNYINDYIDYNNDNLYGEKVVTNE